MLAPRSIKKNLGGFTLIELLVGLTVGAIVLIGVIFSWALAVRNNAYVLSVTALNNDLRSITQIISQDVRRATEHPATGSRVPGIVEAPESGGCIAFYAGFVNDNDTNNFDVLVRSAYGIDQGGSLWIWNPDSTDTPTCGPDYSGPPPFDELDESENWELLLSAGDRGVSLVEMNFDVSDSRCLDLNTADEWTAGRCNLEENPTNQLELLLIQIELVGRMQISGTERLLRIQDQVKVRNELLL